MTVHLGVKNQLTLPKNIIQEAHLSPGDALEIIFEGDQIILRPQIHVPREQAYFWTKDWQEGERAADEDIRHGRVSGPFNDMKSLKKSLKKPKA